MEKVYIVYWSMTENTHTMADAIADGVKKAGKEAEVTQVSMMDASLLKDAKVFALGCPAMGAEVLEENEMEPFVSSIENDVNGKTIALFGSYGWGDGQWMRDWCDRMEAHGATILHSCGLICKETPDDGTLAECLVLGQELASLL